jgi:hypothetical protein
MTPVVAILGALAVAEPASLAECRRLEQAFDTTAMPAPCGRALDDAALPVTDRVDAARLLAFALVTNGDSAGAEAAFTRLLALSPGWTLPSSASPRQRDAFARAKARLDREGTVTVTAVARRDADGGLEISAELVDGLRRVADVRWALSPASGGAAVTGPLLPTASSSAWAARAPIGDAAGCRVEALAADGSVIAADECDGMTATQTSTEEAPLPWGVIGAGAGGAAVVAVAVGTLIWAFHSGPLAPPAAVTVSIE